MQDGSRTMDEQFSQITVAVLRSADEMSLAASRDLARYQPVDCRRKNMDDGVTSKKTDSKAGR